MIFDRFEDQGLAQFSYAVGDGSAGRVAIVDPRRDVDVYLEYAASRRLRITDVLETHIHADYCSGAMELADRADAVLWLSAYDDGEAYDVSFPHRELQQGDVVALGDVHLEVLHTPGHTPEHISYLIYDEERSDRIPQVLLSGDFLLIGGVGRPDLIGEEAQLELAEALYDAVHEKLLPLPPGVEIRPAHGAGSLCGSGMSVRPVSTLGLERELNPYLDPALSPEAFIERLLNSLPPFPDYYRRMKKVNAAGPPPLGNVEEPTPLHAAELRARVGDGAIVLDLRHQLAFGGGHIPGAFGIGGDDRLSQWAAWVVPYHRALLLVGEPGQDLELAVRRLARVGLDRVEGALEGGMQEWVSSGYEVEGVEQLSVPRLREIVVAGEGLVVLDVRTDEEWQAGHIEGALHIFAGDLEDRLAEVPEEAPLAVICSSGYRSTVAASVLQRAGRRKVLNVPGGMRAWHSREYPTVRPE